MTENSSIYTVLNGLRDIDEISSLNDADRSCLEEIKQELVASGQTTRFGVNLLHKHFDLEEGEVLVERFDARQRRLIASVEPRTVKKKLIAKMWKFT